MPLLLQQWTGEQQKLGTGGVGAAGDTVGQHTHGRDGETGARWGLNEKCPPQSQALNT